MTDRDALIEPAAVLGPISASARTRPRLLARTVDPLVKNSIVMATNVFIAAVLGFMFWTLAARWYSPSEVGPVSALIGLVGLTSALSTLGMPETVLRFLGSSTDQFGLLARAAVTVAAIGLASGVVVGLVWRLAGRPIGGSTVLIVALVAVMVAANATANVADSAVVAVGRPMILIVESLSGGVTKNVLLALAVALGVGSVGLVAALALAVVIGGLALLIRMHRSITLTRDRDHPALLRRSRSYSFVNWVGGAASMVPAATVGTIAIAKIGPAAGAYIGVPLMILAAINVIPATAAKSLFAEASLDPRHLAALTRRTMLFTWAMLAPVAAAIALVGPRLLGAFGSEYVVNSTSALRWMCLASIAAASNYVGDVVLNVRMDRIEYLVANVAGSVCVFVAAFIGASASVAGIAVGWVAGQAMYGVIVWAMVAGRPFARRGLEVPRD